MAVVGARDVRERQRLRQLRGQGHGLAVQPRELACARRAVHLTQHEAAVALGRHLPHPQRARAA